MREILIICVLCVFFANESGAGLVTVIQNDGPSNRGKNAEIISAPVNVFDDGTVNEAMQGFNERQDVTLTQAIMADGLNGNKLSMETTAIIRGKPRRLLFQGYLLNDRLVLWTDGITQSGKRANDYVDLTRR